MLTLTLLSALFEHLALGGVVLDRQGRVVAYNRDETRDFFTCLDIAGLGKNLHANTERWR